MKVAAYDTGVTTGAAWATMPELWLQPEFSIIKMVRSSFENGTGGTCQIRGHDTSERSWHILNHVADISPDRVVAEDFVLFQDRHIGADREALEPHGINANLRFMWWLSSMADENDWPSDVGPPELPRLDFQMPGERKVVTDRQLREWKLWRTPTKSGGPHAMDAVRHLLVYLRKMKDGRVV